MPSKNQKLKINLAKKLKKDIKKKFLGAPTTFSIPHSVLESSLMVGLPMLYPYTFHPSIFEGKNRLNLV